MSSFIGDGGAGGGIGAEAGGGGDGGGIGAEGNGGGGDGGGIGASQAPSFLDILGGGGAGGGIGAEAGGGGDGGGIGMEGEGGGGDGGGIGASSLGWTWLWSGSSVPGIGYRSSAPTGLSRLPGRLTVAASTLVATKSSGMIEARSMASFMLCG